MSQGGSSEDGRANEDQDSAGDFGGRGGIVAAGVRVAGKILLNACYKLYGVPRALNTIMGKRTSHSIRLLTTRWWIVTRNDEQRTLACNGRPRGASPLNDNAQAGLFVY